MGAWITKRLAIASTNAFARGAPRSNRAGELASPRRSRINRIICGVSGHLNDHLFQTSRDRVNQRICKRRTKEQPRGELASPRRSRINRIICGVSGHLNDHLFQTSRDRVNQRVCKRRTILVPRSNRAGELVWTPLVVHALIELFVESVGA